jgi:hypothetical protein
MRITTTPPPWYQYGFSEDRKVLIVSNDADPLQMSPWRGIPIIRPGEFVSRVDAMRRASRRRS